MVRPPPPFGENLTNVVRDAAQDYVAGTESPKLPTVIRRDLPSDNRAAPACRRLVSTRMSVGR